MTQVLHYVSVLFLSALSNQLAHSNNLAQIKELEVIQWDKT